MSKSARIYFFRYKIHDQSIGEPASHVFGTVFFTITIIDTAESSGKNVWTKDTSCEVRHPYGEEYERNSFEVYFPDDVPYALPFIEFSDEVEAFVRQCVGESGRGINIQDSVNVSIRNSTIPVTKTVTLTLPETGGGW